MRLVCPQCAHTFYVAAGVAATCPSCGYAPGGAAPKPSATPVYTVPAAPVVTPEVSGSTTLAPAKTNGLATSSLVLGILGLPFGVFSLGLLPILAVVLGGVALSQIKRDQTQGRGMAIWGLALGGFGLGALVLFYMFAGLV